MLYTSGQTSFSFGNGTQELGKSTGLRMSQDNRSSDDQKTGEPKPKKPYQKPEFRYERVFETMALSCGKRIGFGGDCRPRPRQS